MAPVVPAPQKNRSLIPSLVPMRAFTDDEDAAFGELEDDADLDALVEMLFPDAPKPFVPR